MTGDPLLCLPDDLQLKLNKIVKQYPQTKDPIYELIAHFTEPQKHKKPKLDISVGDLQCTFQECSFSSPKRGKYSLCIHEQGVSLKAKETEMVLTFDRISRILLLPTPAKDKHFTVVIVPKSKSHVLDTDTIVFSFEEKPFKIDTVWKLNGNTTFDRIKAALSRITTHVIEPDTNVFLSSKQAAKNSKVSPGKVYLDCYVKSKDGILYLLPGGMFFGFKKPMMYIDTTAPSFHELGVQCVTGRTFDLVATLVDNEKEELIEFKMLDQGEYDGTYH
jgi:hypothetical protein